MQDEDFEAEWSAHGWGHFEAVGKQGEAIEPDHAEVGAGLDLELPGLLAQGLGEWWSGFADIGDLPELTIGDFAEAGADLIWGFGLALKWQGVAVEGKLPRGGGQVLAISRFGLGNGIEGACTVGE